MTKKPNKQYPEITPEAFCLAWQSSESLAEVARKTGIPGPICAARASLYRKKNIQLKFFKPGRKAGINVDEINKLIESMGGSPATAGPKKARPPEKSPEEKIAEDESRRRKNADLLRDLLSKSG